MRPITELDEMKEIQLSIMQRLHEYCEEKNIKYSLSHGSLIGAVRHKGFIPWDDDIDIFMPREEYERFCASFSKEHNSLGLQIVNSHTTPYFGRPMTKVIDQRTVLIEPNYLFDDEIGVNVDIWPIDGVPDLTRDQLRHTKKIKVLLNVMYARILRLGACRNPKEKIAHIISSPFSAKRIVHRIESELKKIPYSTSNKVSCYVDPYKKMFEKSWFDNRILVPFEDKYFYIAEDAEKILTSLYGDYMKLPPEDKRKPHHITNAFWKD